MLLVGVLLVAALSTAGASARLQSHGSDAARGQMLAEGLMSEILVQNYIDPGPNPVFGPEAGETTTPPARLNFNDVDDYNGWVESPPQNKDGSTIPNFVGWRRRVTVSWVAPSSLTQPVNYDAGVKLITVSVSHNGVLVARQVAIKANNPKAGS